MDETFDAGFKLNECTEISGARDDAADAVAERELAGNGIPRVGL